jgi:hypothetical protein
VVDLDFLKKFIPYELLLAQRRAMVWGSDASKVLPNAYIGFYLVRLEVMDGPGKAKDVPQGPEISAHIQELLRKVLRDSDIPARISDHEHLAILRDVAPRHAYAVAQRFLTSAASSRLLEQAALRAHVGYVIYPLSLQPNFPVDSWSALLELARRMSRHGDGLGAANGYGLLRGPQIADTSIPESDLVPLAYRNLETLVREGILEIQRIQLLPAG